MIRIGGKDMKNMLKMLPVFVMSCLFATGCFLNPTSDLKKASKKMAKLDSYQMTLDFTIGVKSQGIEMEVPVSLENSYHSKSKASKMNISISVFGMTVSSEGYISYSDDNKVITYIKDSSTEEWTKEESDNTVDSQIVSDFIAIAQKIEKVKSDDKSLKKYQIIIAKEDAIKSISSLTSLLSSLDMDIDEEYEVTDDIVIDIYVNKKSKYITKIAFDLTDSIQIKDADTENTSITKFTMELKFDKFNEVEEISIPEDVIKNAIDQKIASAKEDMEDYIQTIEYTYMFEDNIPSKVTATDLDKDGVVPEKVEVTLNSDGEVENGTIVINGLTGTIKDGEVTEVK
jgi:hypothetical protein